jgi:hypothetical protein
MTMILMPSLSTRCTNDPGVSQSMIVGPVVVIMAVNCVECRAMGQQRSSKNTERLCGDSCYQMLVDFVHSVHMTSYISET